MKGFSIFLIMMAVVGGAILATLTIISSSFLSMEFFLCLWMYVNCGLMMWVGVKLINE